MTRHAIVTTVIGMLVDRDRLPRGYRRYRSSGSKYG